MSDRVISNNISMKHTFPSFAKDDGRVCQETLPSVHFLLEGTTLTKLTRFRPLVVSEDFLKTGGRCLTVLSESSAAALTMPFFTGV